jgi:hypothetical protein
MRTIDYSSNLVVMMNKAAAFIVPILGLICQMLRPYTSSIFYRSILFTLLLSISHAGINWRPSFNTLLKDLWKLQPTLPFPTPSILTDTSFPYFLGIFFRYAMNIVLILLFMVILNSIKHIEQRIASRFTRTMFHNLCQLFIMNYLITYVLLIIPDLIPIQINEIIEMAYSGVPAPYLFYSILSSLTWAGTNILALVLIIIPSWCNVFGIAKKSKNLNTVILPEKYNKIKVIFNDLEFHWKRAFPFFILFMVRSIVLPTIMKIGIFLSSGLVFGVSLTFTGLVLLYICAFRPIRSRLQLAEYILYELLLVGMVVAGT